MALEQRDSLCPGVLPSFAWSVPGQVRLTGCFPSGPCVRSPPNQTIPALVGCAGTLGHVYLCVQRWGRAPAGELDPFPCLGLSGALPTPRPASLPLQIYHGKIKSKASEPFLVGRNPRVEFVGSTTGKDNNISIVLKNVEFSDAGKYTCHVKNPKEKHMEHNATIFLTVVQKSKCRPRGSGDANPGCPHLDSGLWRCMGCPGFLEVLGMVWPRAPLCCGLVEGVAAFWGGLCSWELPAPPRAPSAPSLLQWWRQTTL